MVILFVVLLIIVLIFTQLYLKPSRVIYLKKLLMPVGLTCFLLCLVLFSDTSVNSARKGLELWFNIVFPSLFPFFVVSELLGTTGFIRAIGILMEPIMRPLFNVPGCGSFAFAMGITSGYPVGAKITTSMREDNLLTKTEAERLLAFTNNSGPLFIVGAVAVGMLKRPELGIFLLICHILACVTVGIAFRFYRASEVNSDKKSNKKLLLRFKSEMILLRKNMNLNLGEMLGSAIRNSVSTILAIGGFIILFSVVINLLLDTGIITFISNMLWSFLGTAGIKKELIPAVLSGLFEITTGTNMAAGIADLGFPAKLSVISFIIGWAGISVHSQVLSIISKSDISIKPYLFGKLLQGALAAVYTFLGIKIAGMFSLSYKPAFKTFTPDSPQNWNSLISFSLKSLVVSLCIILLCILFSVFRILLSKRSSKAI